MTNFQFYFRKDSNTQDEYDICKKYFPTYLCRTELDTNIKNVVCRYSALPFNLELEKDLHNLGLNPINSSSEHSYIADMSYIYDLEELTFPTWDKLEYVPGDFPLVIKGRTNSRKFEWNTKMFAKTKADAINIMHDLWHDPLIGPQGLVFRKYIPLKTLEIGINGMPMTNEWRCFFYQDKLIDYGFYWATLDNLSLINEDEFIQNGLPLALKAAKIVSDFTNFFVIDIAQDETGKYWVVELNDGQMSGLSLIDPDRFYKNLSAILNK